MIAKNYMTVIYRTGGTENFQWRKCLPVSTFEEAIKQKQALVRAGYLALIHRTAQIESIGLPETYDASRSVSTGVL